MVETEEDDDDDDEAEEDELFSEEEREESTEEEEESFDDSDVPEVEESAEEGRLVEEPVPFWQLAKEQEIRQRVNRESPKRFIFICFLFLLIGC